ncbi:MAG: bifunctional adenosylcobinamide kinase/adenosylcobinamide-phosphate guanylyltransferase, partial [Synergistaceae bacterium]|nr:bifunctional adenosylcobinamide kinase/adenosylcobinamide-phosphate guanylyltransferase [Synergistaceae bacterium]
LRNAILIGDEISSGVIPVSKFERQWRDETGRLYQFLADNADIVDRVFVGLALRLKG